MYQYDMLARSISAGNGYRWYSETDLPTVLPYLKLDLTSIDYDPRGVLSSFRPPLYPTLLAVIYSFFGTGADRFLIVRIFQTLLGALLAPMTYALAERLFPGNIAVARISASCIAFYPMLVIYPLSLATENLFFILILSSILSLQKAKQSIENKGSSYVKNNSFFVKARWFILSGILLGLTCLTRSVAQIFAILAVLWVWLVLKQWKMALVSLSLIAVVIGPWIVRNSLLYRKFTGIESALGYDLYLGYYPTGTGTFQFPQSLDLMTIVNDSQRDEVGVKDTIGFLKADPGRFIYLFARRTGYFFGLERRALTYFYSNNYFGHIDSPILGGIFAIFCLPFVALCSSGVAGLPLIKISKESWLIILFLVGYISPHLLIIAEDRFHLTLIPILAIFGAHFWTDGWKTIRQKWNGSKVGKATLIIVIIVILLLFINWGLELWRDADKLSLLFSSNGNQSFLSY